MATLVTNHINGVYLRDALEELLDRAPSGHLDAAVAYVTSPDRLLRLTEDFDIPTEKLTQMSWVRTLKKLLKRRAFSSRGSERGNVNAN